MLLTESVIDSWQNILQDCQEFIALSFEYDYGRHFRPLFSPTHSPVILEIDHWQLEDAENDQQEAKAASEQHAVSVQEKAGHFHHDQQDIDRRLRIITQSDTSDDAVRRFEDSMAKLRILDITDGYFKQLSEVDTLRYVLLELHVERRD